MSKEFNQPNWSELLQNAHDRAFAIAADFSTRGGENSHYESPNISNDEANVAALELLRIYDGLPVPVIRQVLRQAEFWMGAVTVLNCGEATEFARAFEGWKRAHEKSL